MKKNKSVRALMVLCMLVVSLFCTTMLFGCKEKGTTYTYSEIKVEGPAEYETGFESIRTMYDSLYEGSTITVKSKKLIFKIGEDEQEMSFTKDGDKYVFNGEVAERIANGFASMGPEMKGFEIEYYGIEAETGFDLVIEERMDGESFKIIMSFVK